MQHMIKYDDFVQTLVVAVVMAHSKYNGCGWMQWITVFSGELTRPSAMRIIHNLHKCKMGANESNDIKAQSFYNKGPFETWNEKFKTLNRAC